MTQRLRIDLAEARRQGLELTSVEPAACLPEERDCIFAEEVRYFLADAAPVERSLHLPWLLALARGEEASETKDWQEKWHTE